MKLNAGTRPALNAAKEWFRPKRTTSEWIAFEKRPIIDGSYKTPVEALRINYEMTSRLIEECGIEPISIRGLDRLRFVFVLPRTARAHFLNAIRGVRRGPSVRIIQPSSGLPEVTYTAREIADLGKQVDLQVLRFTWHIQHETSDGFSGEEYGAEIEFWDDDSPVGEIRYFDDEWVAPRHNGTARRIRLSEGTTKTPLSHLTNFSPREFDSLIATTFRSVKDASLDTIHYPIDIVFTWVDSNDPHWISKKNRFSTTTSIHAEAASEARYLNRDELKYALRSIWMFAPWVRNIYIVTDDQTPSWLDKHQDRVKIVNHSEIFTDKNHLPSFNSHAIESQIHHIDELSECFIYLNDDMMFGRPVVPGLFFYSNGVAKHFRSQSRVPFFPKSALDTPVDQATKNSRDILERRFGKQQSQVFEHAPYALRKTVMREIENEFNAEYVETAKSRFRGMDDLNIPSHLAHYWAYQTGRSIPGSLAFTYIGLAVPDVQQRLQRLEKRKNVDAFCINDTFTENIDLIEQNRIVSDFFTSYFPVPAPWEK